MATQDNKMALSISEVVIDIVQLLGQVGIFSATLMTATIGLMVTGLGSVIGIFSLILSINDWLNGLDDLKKGRDVSYGSYRRIRTLEEFTDPNNICYQLFSNLTEIAQKSLLDIKQYLENNQKNILMSKKLFIPADFNSFILYQTILSWVDLNEAIITANDGAYTDYIEFVHISDYIDTNNIFEQDCVRLKELILENNVDVLVIFLNALESLDKELLLRSKNTDLTDFTKTDILYLYNKTQILLSIFKEGGQLYNNLKQELIPQSYDVATLMISIFRYLDYGYALANNNTQILQNLYQDDEFISGISIDSYVANQAGFEWILEILKSYSVDFGIILFNTIYIEKYKKEIEYRFNKDSSKYSEGFYKSILEYIKNFEIKSNQFYNYFCLENTIKYFYLKGYNTINQEMITYKSYDDKGYIIDKIPQFDTYVTFNYKNIYDYIFNFKDTGLYNQYFLNSKLLNNNQTYNFSLCSAWLEDNTYHFDTGLSWRDKGRMQKYQYSFKEMLDYPYTTEEYFEQILKSRELFAVLFVNAFQKQNTRYYCGYLRDLANILFNNGFNYDKLDDNNAIIDMIIRSKKLFEVRYINGIISNSNYKSVFLALVNNTLKYQQNYTFKSFSNRYTGIDCYKILEQKGLKQILWESYLETYGSYGFDIINAKREEVFNNLLQQDLEVLRVILLELKAFTVDFEIENADYSSIFSDYTVNKYDLKLFEIMKQALSLLKSNYGKYQKFDMTIIKPLYNYQNNVLYFYGLFRPFDILVQSYNRTSGISDIYYLLNQISFDTLFEYSQGNFFSKLLQIDNALELKPEKYTLVAKYQDIITTLENSLLSKAKQVDKQQFISSFNQETIEKELYENQKYLDTLPKQLVVAQPVEQPVVEEPVEQPVEQNVSDLLVEDKNNQIQYQTELIASQYQQQQSQKQIIVDKKLLKKYTLYGILGLGIFKILRR